MKKNLCHPKEISTPYHHEKTFTSVSVIIRICWHCQRTKAHMNRQLVWIHITYQSGRIQVYLLYHAGFRVGIRCVG